MSVFGLSTCSTSTRNGPWSCCFQPKKPVPPGDGSNSAVSPNHCAIRAGSVRAAHTLVSGALMSMLRVMSSGAMIASSRWLMCNSRVAHQPPKCNPTVAYDLYLAAVAVDHVAGQLLAEGRVGAQSIASLGHIALLQRCGELGDVAVVHLPGPILPAERLAPDGADTQAAEGVGELGGA